MSECKENERKLNSAGSWRAFASTQSSATQDNHQEQEKAPSGKEGRPASGRGRDALSRRVGRWVCALRQRR